MSNKEIIYGFGVNPNLTTNHFYIIIPSKNNEMVQIYERFSWTDAEEQIIGKSDVLKLEISKHKWNKLSPDVSAEFNARLKKEKLKMRKRNVKWKQRKECFQNYAWQVEYPGIRV